MTRIPRSPAQGSWQHRDTRLRHVDASAARRQGRLAHSLPRGRLSAPESAVSRLHPYN